MKKLTIEQKAQRYDDAINAIKELKAKHPTALVIKDWIKENFPELAESEDDRIRKKLIRAFQSLNTIKLWCGIERTDIIAWLERQGEQKPVDKVKFHKGDWIIHQGTENIYQVVAVLSDHYQLKYGDNYTIQKRSDVDRCARLWDITKDAKDGDVLATEPIERQGHYSPFVAIYKKQNEEGFDSYCFIGFDGKFYEAAAGHFTEKIHPSTKEQRDTLMKAMADAGYTFDFEKRALKKLNKFHD